LESWGCLRPTSSARKLSNVSKTPKSCRSGYDRTKSVYFQNPTFGFYFLRLTSARLFQNIRKLEAALEERDREIQRLKAAAEVANLRR
jgi:CRP/FNR family transcriptional regulator, cyclic AMP receptor protein